MRPLLPLLLAGVLLATTPASISAQADTPPLRIGVTLPAYGSWVANVGGERVAVVPILPEGADPHIYRPSPDDLERLTTLDAVVENGLGHDAYLDELLTAADRADLPRIRPADGGALLQTASGVANGHSFLSILGATREIRHLADSLGRLDPDAADAYRANARAYIVRLRRLLADALARLETLGPGATRIPIATVHEGYDYLFHELGLEVAAVIQPRHGVEPSAKQLADTIRRIREAGVKVLFTEMDFAKRYVDTLYRETGCRVARLTHGTGPTSAEGVPIEERFEHDLRTNLDAILEALGDNRAEPGGQPSP